MPSKEQADSRNRAPSKRQEHHQQAQHVDPANQQIVTPTPAQPARLGVGVLRAHDLQQLQRTVGNRATARLLHRTVQLRVQTPVVQRTVIPVYRKNPKDASAQATDRAEVDQFAQESALGHNAGNIGNDLASGGNLMNIPNAEKVILAGHGNVNSLNGYTGSEVAGMLKNQWALPAAYTGVIRISSCKAGDKRGIFFPTSLVEDVSNSLHGYQATVEGLKGNVITGNANSAQPGVDRSLGSDQAFADYKRLEKAHKDLMAQREQEFSLSAGGVAAASVRGLELRIGLLEQELRRHNTSNSLVSSVLAAVTGASSQIAEIKANIEQAQKQIPELQQVAAAERVKVNAKYQQRLSALLAQINAAGVPFGDASVTVSHGPQDRNPNPFPKNSLSYLWMDFLLKEASS